MLTMRLHELVGRLGTESVSVFFRRHGFTVRESRNLAYSKNRKLLNDSMLQRFCEALHCTPNDIFCWNGDRQSHLMKLNEGFSWVNFTELDQMGQAELDRARGQLTELMDGMGQKPLKHEGRLRLNVRRLIEQRQQPHPMTYLMQQGFTEMQAIKLLDPKRKAFKLEVLTKLCICFGCMPNDLFDWEGSAEHDLNVLRKAPVLDLSEYLKKLSSADVVKVMTQFNAMRAGK